MSSESGSTNSSAISPSVTVTATVAVSPPKSAPDAVSVTVTDSSSVSSSPTPPTDTDCGVDQLPVVNVNGCDGTDTAPASPDDTVTDTSWEGRVAKLTSKLPESPSATVNDWRTPAEALDELLHSAQQDSVATTP